jgi:sulfate-transporting ATPase
LLFILGIDKDFDGEVWIKGGLRVGYLAQEPALAEDMDVIGNVLQGVQTKARLVERYHELSQLMGEPDADFDALLKEQVS